MSGFFILYKALAACCNRRPYCKQNKKSAHPTKNSPHRMRALARTFIWICFKLERLNPVKRPVTRTTCPSRKHCLSPP